MQERRKLPALDDAKKLNKPDLNDIGNKNYTDTILRYGGLATKFPQLETNAKSIVPAINELYQSGGASHRTLTKAEYDALPEEEKMNGTIYFISDGGGGGGGGATTLDELDDVNISRVAEGDILYYRGSSGSWVNYRLNLALNEDVDIYNLNEYDTLYASRVGSETTWINGKLPLVCLSYDYASNRDVMVWSEDENSWIPYALALKDLADVIVNDEDVQPNDILYFNGSTSSWCNSKLPLESIDGTASTENDVMIWDAQNDTWKSGKLPLASIDGNPYYLADGDVITWNAESGTWEARAGFGSIDTEGSSYGNALVYMEGHGDYNYAVKSLGTVKMPNVYDTSIPTTQSGESYACEWISFDDAFGRSVRITYQFMINIQDEVYDWEDIRFAIETTADYDSTEELYVCWQSIPPNDDSSYCQMMHIDAFTPFDYGDPESYGNPVAFRLSVHTEVPISLNRISVFIEYHTQAY